MRDRLARWEGDSPRARASADTAGEWKSTVSKICLETVRLPRGVRRPKPEARSPKPARKSAASERRRRGGHFQLSHVRSPRHCRRHRYQEGVGAVAISSCVSHAMAWTRSGPHMSAAACSPPQKAGRSGLPKTAQRMSSSNCAQRCPAGLPCGMPGKGLVMDGAMQQAPQPGRQDKAIRPSPATSKRTGPSTP